MPLTRVTFLINNEFPLFLRREENKSLRDRVGLSCQTGYQYLSEKKSMIRRGKSISPLAYIVTSSYQSINYLKTAVHVSIVGLRFPKLVNANFIQFENDCLDRNVRFAYFWFDLHHIFSIQILTTISCIRLSSCDLKNRTR
jgi:hypothetical protein